MELDLQAALLPAAVLPNGFDWQPWHMQLAVKHAVVLYEGFRGQLDAELLESLRELDGCEETIRMTACDRRFIPEATWLVSAPHSDKLPCGAIQTIGISPGVARIQNLAVLPDYRGMGIGRALILKALRQCRGLAIRRVQLDATEANLAAVKLYRSIGFRIRRAYFRGPRT